MKNLTFSLLAIGLFFLIPRPTLAQKTPDTLVINSKNGQIILVSDSLLKFAPMETQSLIRKALYQMLDSLTDKKNMKLPPRIKKDSVYTRILAKRSFRLTGSFGAALVRDKFSPKLGFGIEFAPQKQDYFRKKGGHYSFLSLMADAAFLFREEDNKYHTYQNTFLDFTLGNKMNPESGHKSITELSIGAGYLLQRSGNYFDKNTFKLFANVGLPNSSFVIRPEFYFSKGKAFPGMTIKLLNIAAYY